MSTISIVAEKSPRSKSKYRAAAGEDEQFGNTMGEALDALTAAWGDRVRESVVLIQRLEPDEYFTESQIARKKDLMARRRSLSTLERAELEQLLDAEVDATVARTDRLVR